MGRKKGGRPRRGAPPEAGLEGVVAVEPGEEARHRARIVAGRRHVADGEKVGLVLLIPGVAPEIEVGALLGEFGKPLDADRREGADPGLGDHRMAVALGGVAGRHVADLVSEHAGELGLVAGQRQQAAGDVDIAPRQREGVDDVAVEHGEGEVPLGEIRVPRDRAADRAHVRPEVVVAIGAAEAVDDAGMLAPADLELVLLRHEGGEHPLAGRRVDRAAAEAKRRRRQKQDEKGRRRRRA